MPNKTASADRIDAHYRLFNKTRINIGALWMTTVRNDNPTGPVDEKA